MLRSTLLALLALGFLSGCVTFRPLPEDPNFELGADEGILIVHTATDVPVVVVAINDEPAARGLSTGVRYDFVVAKAGDYRWSQVTLAPNAGSARGGWRESFALINKRDYWNFRVEPGVINYPGQVEVYRNGSASNYTVRLANRSGLMWVILRERFPELLGRYDVVYTGALPDEFFKRVSRDAAVPVASPEVEVE